MSPPRGHSTVGVPKCCEGFVAIWLHARKEFADNHFQLLFTYIGGTAAFQIKTGRWRGVVREDRVCKECGKGEVEDVEHWLLRCEKWRTHRQPLMAMVQEHYEVDQVDLAAVVLYLACRNYKVLSCISYMWHARFN